MAVVGSSERSTRIISTGVPGAASTFAAALPMPELAPVTTATRLGELVMVLARP